MKKEWRIDIKRHADLAAHVRDWAIKQGFEVFSEDGYHSNTVVTIRNNLEYQRWIMGEKSD